MMLQQQLKQLFGKDYRVESRYEQNRTMYSVMSAEKWAVYAILVLVLFIAEFNMIGALAMLVIEKRKDIAILKAMGALPATIRTIFLLEGTLWSLMGGLSGLALGSTMATAIFGGATPYFAQLMMRATGSPLVPGIMIAVVALCVLPVLWKAPETRPARQR